MLTPLKVLSLGFQKEIHGPVVAIRQIREFYWTMVKLQMLIDSSLEGDNGGCLTHLTKLFKETKQTDEGHLYQDIKLLNIEIHEQSVGTACKEIITKLAVTMEDIFQSLFKSQIFENLIQIVDMSLWPSKKTFYQLFVFTVQISTHNTAQSFGQFG